MNVDNVKWTRFGFGFLFKGGDLLWLARFKHKDNCLVGMHDPINISDEDGAFEDYPEDKIEMVSYAKNDEDPERQIYQTHTLGGVTIINNKNPDMPIPVIEALEHDLTFYDYCLEVIHPLIMDVIMEQNENKTVS